MMPTFPRSPLSSVRRVFPRHRRLSPEHRRRHWPSPWTKRARHSRYSRNPFRAGHAFGATLVRNCYGLSGCSPPGTDLTGLPANGGFYIQASSGLVALPAAGYNYNSDWTPLGGTLTPLEWQLASLHLLLHRNGLAPSTPCRSSRRTPVCPNKPTFSGVIGTSQTCHMRTHASRQRPPIRPFQSTT
jgi:hypothetical protein